MNPVDAKPLLADIYRHGLEAVSPGNALARALEDEPRVDHVWVIALGKAAPAMAEAAIAVLAARGRVPSGGLIVAPDDAVAPHPTVPVVVGDHPEPGARSRAAADALGRLVRRIPPDATIWVLLSGGTTSLVGAPQPGIALHELKDLYGQLLRSGLDITAMNRIRKRFTRWSAGRLARSLEHAARINCYIVSDVIGDDLASIGSGPCVPDPSTAADVSAALSRAALLDRLAPALRQHLDAAERGKIPETPKAGDRAFDRVLCRIVASSRLALEAAGARARELGLNADVVASPIAGEAATVGVRIAEQLRAMAGAGDGRPMRCLIFGGETTVTIGDIAGMGGRSQELALAAAQVLSGVPPPVALLAAGTDGRDGPTDAAGAIVDGATWQAAAARRNPAEDLRRHDAYHALAAAGALLKTGPTGTNVMDIVLGVA
jgi:hydroxypyruvate reductase